MNGWFDRWGAMDSTTDRAFYGTPDEEDDADTYQPFHNPWRIQRPDFDTWMFR